jgi:hypothetical protein
VFVKVSAKAEFPDVRSVISFDVVSSFAIVFLFYSSFVESIVDLDRGGV